MVLLKSWILAMSAIALSVVQAKSTLTETVTIMTYVTLESETETVTPTTTIYTGSEPQPETHESSKAVETSVLPKTTETITSKQTHCTYDTITKTVTVASDVCPWDLPKNSTDTISCGFSKQTVTETVTQPAKTYTSVKPGTTKVITRDCEPSVETVTQSAAIKTVTQEDGQVTTITQPPVISTVTHPGSVTTETVTESGQTQTITQSASVRTITTEKTIFTGNNSTATSKDSSVATPQSLRNISSIANSGARSGGLPPTLSVLDLSTSSTTSTVI